MSINSENIVTIQRNDAKARCKSFLCKQAIATAASCLISLSSGLTLGFSSMLLPELREDKTIHYETTHESWIASVTTLSMIVGGLCSGSILDRYGRRFTHILLGIPFVAGWIIIASANSTSIIILGRFITGISTGANRPVTMVYIGEIADPKIRSIALYAPGLLTPLGVLISHVIGYYVGWRISSFIFIVPAVVSSAVFLFLKESPLWLIAKGRTTEGEESFRWFRGTDDLSENELKSVLEKHCEKREMTFQEINNLIRSRGFIKPMLILFVIMINIQVSGINALNFYSQDVFKKVFSGNIDPFLLTMLMDCIRNAVCLILCLVGNLVSRKTTYLISNFGATLSALGLVICFQLNFHTFAGLSLTCFVIYVIFSSVGMSTGWAFVPELLPTSARGLGTGINSTFSFITLFILVKTLPDIVQEYGVTGLFVFFSIATLICGVILCFTLPETNGKTLQSIEDSYNKKKIKTNVMEIKSLGVK